MFKDTERRLSGYEEPHQNLPQGNELSRDRLDTLRDVWSDGS